MLLLGAKMLLARPTSFRTLWPGAVVEDNTLQVHISAVLEPGSVVVQVQDNGPGIAPEIRASLFQPFVSAGKKNGLGLGLALTRQTVIEHGGDMWVESGSGCGARFRFRLPGAQVAQAQSLHA